MERRYTCVMSGDAPKGQLSTKQLLALEQLLDDIEALPESERIDAITHSDVDAEVRKAAQSKIEGNAATIEQDPSKLEGLASPQSSGRISLAVSSVSTRSCV